ncbi:hypothetical protein CCMSSC00406_0005315 [Pleurotus cornucopiae]|uniref:Uncharacterized protein n=1 Tax=Pleurotus cornucopiae TaxID=5321 RepID=A0ACB7INI7_PLECO|nr:hypothetical protein CCMSSC00406_0005315 [Pleurotus cornucopiae]
MLFGIGQTRYEQLPTSVVSSENLRGKGSRLRLPRIGIALSLSTAFICLFIFVSSQKRSPVYNALDHFQSLNIAPTVDNGTATRRRAVATTLYSSNYAIATAVLAHSLRRANVSSRLLLIYIEGRISEEALCISRAAGWEPLPVPFIPPPHHGNGILEWYQDQYTKLNIWGLDQHGVDRLVYLDADTLVFRNIDELFDIPFNFAAVPDVFAPDDPRGFSLSFNAGVLALRPSSKILADMTKKIETANFPLEQAEQSFLNAYFASKRALLPYIYNAGIVIKRQSSDLWEELKREMKIMHFTNVKPFLEENQAADKILSEVELEAAIHGACERKGLYSEEIESWRDAYRRMMRNKGDSISRCRAV